MAKTAVILAPVSLLTADCKRRRASRPRFSKPRTAVLEARPSARWPVPESHKPLVPSNPHGRMALRVLCCYRSPRGSRAENIRRGKAAPENPHTAVPSERDRPWALYLAEPFSCPPRFTRSAASGYTKNSRKICAMHSYICMYNFINNREFANKTHDYVKLLFFPFLLFAINRNGKYFKRRWP